MPKRLEDAVKRGVTEEALIEQLNEEYLEEVYNKPIQPRKLYKQTQQRMNEINTVFNQHGALVRSIEFESMMQTSEVAWSPAKINKLKKMMGIRSVRKDGLWYWTRPLDPTGKGFMDTKLLDARKRMLRDRSRHLRDIRRPAARHLLSIMRSMGYDAPPEAVMHQMYDIKQYSRNTIIRCKSALGIVTYKDKDDDGDGKWHWLYFAPEMIDWWKNELRNPSWVDGKVPKEYIHAKAWEVNGWSRLLFKLAEPRVVQRGVGRAPTGELYEYYRLR